MSIKKFYATADTTITNAYKEDLRMRATDSNMGLADSLEVFFIYGQIPDPQAQAADKLEEARILLKFDTVDLMAYYSNSFPNDVKFVLKMVNAEHPLTLPKNYSLKAYSLGESFSEGSGLDMDSYSDEDVASWTNRQPLTPWTTPGAKQGADTLIGSQVFDTGIEDLEIDVTSYIEDIFNGTTDNGIVIMMDSTVTDGSQTNNYYTKKFFARSSEFFFKRPAIEARRSDAKADNRGNFFAKSKAFSSAQNTQRVYLYNSVDGERSDFTLPDVDEELYVRFYTDAERTTLATLDPSADFVAATNEATGIYYVDVVLDDFTVTKIYDQWYFADAGDAASVDRTVVHEGNITVRKRTSQPNSGEIDYRVDITNLKKSYTRYETAKFRVYTRQKDWNPTIYTVASKEIENLVVEKMYYKIVRLVDDTDVVEYGIGTSGNNKEHTLVSYDASGSYFDFDMSLLESGYMYGIKLMFSVNGERKEQPEIFKFRVD